MFFHFSINSASASGSAIKAVNCEKCAHPFSYVMTRSFTVSHVNPFGLGQATPEQIKSAADHELRKMLEKGCDAVPCPKCGAYQAHMYFMARGKHAQNFRTTTRNIGTILVGISVVLITAISLLTEYRLGLTDNDRYLVIAAGVTTAAMCIAIAVFLFRRRNAQIKEFDPNDVIDISEQKLEGQRRAHEAQELIQSAHASDGEGVG